MPLISVIMPAYNVELYIKDAIESILNQTIDDFEFLIFNDGSTDRTHDIIISFTDSRIKYRKIDSNEGYLNLLNAGLLRAKGKYIARMDADDISLPNRFEEQVAYLENHPGVGICGTWIEFIGTRSGTIELPVTFEEIQYGLFFGCPLNHPTVMMKRELILKYNLTYNKKYYLAEDHFLFAEASLHFKIVNLPTVLLRYRIHATQIGSAKWREQFLVKSNIQSTLFTNMLAYCSDEDYEWLFNFLSEQSFPDEKWSNEVAIFRNRIIAGNEKKMIYPQEIVEAATTNLFESKKKNNFYNYFFHKYYNQKTFNFRLLISFFKEKYSPSKYLGKKLSFLFIIKCLVKYQKQSILPK